MHGFRAWLRRLFALPQVSDLSRRVAELERAELERETVTAEQIEQLKKLYKRLRTRDSRESAAAQSTTPTKDSIRRALLSRRMGTNGISDQDQDR